MCSRVLNAIFIVAMISIPTWANAQKAFRCGNTYSQTPCADGKTVDITDTRTAAQQKQAAAATSNRVEAVGALEKARVARERRELTARKTPAAVIAPAAGPFGVPAKNDKALAKRRKKAASDLAAAAPAKTKVKQPAKAAKAQERKS